MKLGSRFRIYLILAGCLILSRPAQAKIEIFGVTYKSENYVVVVFQGQAIGHKALSEYVLRKLKSFLVGEFTERGTLTQDPAKKQEIALKFSNSTVFDDGRSKVIGIFKKSSPFGLGKGDFENPVALIRAVYSTTEKPLKPVEERLLGKGLDAPLDEILRPAGQTIEIKNFTIKDQGKDYLPILYPFMTEYFLTTDGIVNLLHARAPITDIVAETDGSKKEGQHRAIGLGRLYQFLGLKKVVVIETDPNLPDKAAMILTSPVSEFVGLDLESAADGTRISPWRRRLLAAEKPARIPFRERELYELRPSLESIGYCRRLFGK